MEIPLRSRSYWLGTAVLVAFLVVGSVPAFSRPLAIDGPVGGFSLQNAAQDSLSSVRVKTKSPTWAMIRSGLVPGWGQFYNEQYIKSGLVFAIEGLLIGGAVVEHRRAEDDHREYEDVSRSDQEREDAWLRYSRRIDKRNTCLWYLAGAKFLSMVDAYVDAHLYRFDQGPLAVRLEAGSEERWDVGVVVRYKLR
jgi:hypothetical protein